MFSSVLVANRGEIAVRVIATLRRLGVHSIAVYSDADAGAPHVLEADEALRLGAAPAAESYLSIDRVLDAARDAGAEAIHPGYGFLSENPAFARACESAGIAFVGPPAEAMEALGDKVRAKAAAEGAGVPVLPGLYRPGLTDEEIVSFAGSDGVFPLMVKAAAGGGGRGMRIVEAPDALPDALQAARREAQAGFGDDALLVESYVERARHVEVQLLADAHGAVIHLGERECSLQRRHQKVIEESPSPVVGAALRERLGDAAVRIARAAGYVGAGTAEFILPAGDPERFAFLEVNARLQVEHPVTELVCGLDLVEQQLRIAAGEPLALRQEDVALNGHAIEARVCAEDPEEGFLPATGTIVLAREPEGEGVRVDSGVAAGSVVTPFYDSLLAKVVAHGRDREEAVERLLRALGDLRILGVTTNTGFLARLLNSAQVRAGDLDTGLIERGTVAERPPEEEAEQAAAAVASAEAQALYGRGAGGDPWDALLGWRMCGRAPLRWELAPRGSGDVVTVTIDGRLDDAQVTVGDRSWRMRASAAGPGRLMVALDGRARAWDHVAVGEERMVAAGADAFAFRLLAPVVEGADAAGEGSLEAPMPGTVLAVKVAGGDEVHEGDVLVVMESMKMEMTLTAPGDATVRNVHVSVGEGVDQGQALVELEEAAG